LFDDDRDRRTSANDVDRRFEVPDEDSPADGVRKISEIITSTDGEPNHIVFTYDEQGRVQEYSSANDVDRRFSVSTGVIGG